MQYCRCNTVGQTKKLAPSQKLVFDSEKIIIVVELVAEYKTSF
jgi:hypothetical protein